MNDIYQQILKFWFRDGNNSDFQSFWFDSSPDKFITDNFKEYVDNPSLLNETDSNDKLLAKIILLDQFTRNIYRNTQQFRKNDILALCLAKSLLEKDVDFLLPIEKRIFLLLPLRHSNLESNLDYVINRISLYNSNAPIIEKFKRATLINYERTTDSIRLSKKIALFDYNSILDNIIDYTDFQTTTEEMKNIAKQYSYLYSSKKNILISLSGGVDSMVLLRITKILETYLPIKVYACYVYYGNRKESYDEMKFLEYYCSLLKVPFYIREINHIHRNSVDDRNFYESHTKNIRFNLYKEVSRETNSDYVCLGHHQDDVIENIFTNLFKGISILDLTGMTEYSEQNGVYIRRPLIYMRKDEIFSLAEKLKVPYFKNTTISTCNRGVLREQILPLIYSQFGTGVAQNIINIGKESDYMKIEKEKQINDVLTGITVTKLGFYLPNNELLRDKQVLIKLLHRSNLNMISNNCYSEYVKWHVKPSSNLFILSSNAYIVIENEQFILFRKEVMDNLTIKSWTLNIIENKPIVCTYKALCNGKFTILSSTNYTIKNLGYNKSDPIRKQYSLKHFRNKIPLVHTNAKSIEKVYLTFSL